MKTPTAADLIRDEEDLLKAGIALQGEGLRLLLAEMQALATMIPAGKPQGPHDEAETEAGFDNMPV